jgi:glycolate oxidase iron-sulfur subunit
MDSPRGRIHLLTQLLDGAPLTEAGASHFDRCLGCMACMTACPSGVQYDQLLEAAREMTATGSVRERAIFSVFPYPRRLRALSTPLRARSAPALTSGCRCLVFSGRHCGSRRGSRGNSGCRSGSRPAGRAAPWWGC